MSRRALIVAVLPCAACIIPDRDIQVDPGLDNQSAVRIVERAPRVPEMDDHCNVDDIEKAELEYCPEVRGDLPSGLVRPVTGDNFCICPAGPRSDLRALPNFIIYAEDGDRERDRPKDTLYGVALLDPGLEDSAPADAAAYRNYWELGREGELVDVGEDRVDDDGTIDRTAAPLGRRVLDLWRFPFGISDENVPLAGHVDLCNDNAGDPLTPGLHDLRFMVTDRPFFRPEVPDQEHPTFDPAQFGVPDLAAGASYAVIDYVFECIDASDPEVKAHDDAQKALAIDDPKRKPLICDCQDPGPQ